MAEDLLRIAGEAQRLLDIVGAVFQENNIALPVKQFLAVGEIGKTAHDGEQVSVSFGNMSDGLPGATGANPQACTASYQASFSVEIVRCTPKMASGGYGKAAPPEASTITEYSVSRFIDAWLLVRVAQRFSGQKSEYSVTTGEDSGQLQGIILSVNTGV